MNNEFSLKELYDVQIKTTQNIEIGGKIFEAGETFIALDKISLANFKEIRKITTANGGHGYEPKVWWETTRDVQLNFEQGIFNKFQMSVMTNAKLFKASSDPIYLPKREVIKTGLGETSITLHSIPYTPRFAYLTSTGEKIQVEYGDTTIVTGLQQNTSYIFDYYERNDNSYQTLRIGTQLSNHYFTLTGRTRVKDDVTGQERTGIIHIPRLKLMSDLSMRLGEKAMPVVGSMYALACPTGSYGNKQVMEVIFLTEDIDSDI